MKNYSVGVVSVPHKLNKKLVEEILKQGDDIHIDIPDNLTPRVKKGDHPLIFQEEKK